MSCSIIVTWPKVHRLSKKLGEEVIDMCLTNAI